MIKVQRTHGAGGILSRKYRFAEELFVTENTRVSPPSIVATAGS